LSPERRGSRRSLLAAGVILLLLGLLGGVRAYYGNRPLGPVGPGVLERTAILGGFDEQVNLPDFSGGRLTAVFGGFSLDLRGVETRKDPINLEVTAICGGGTIRVPEGWTVSVQTHTLLGGVEQHLGDSVKDEEEGAHPVRPIQTVPTRHHLVIDGLLFCGGLEVKH